MKYTNNGNLEILSNVNSVQELKKLNIKEKKILADEIRQYIIENVSKTGGHLSSNLGVVELTIALHSIFDTPKDKIVWDVGHQTYTHKILTGRKKQFSTLRKFNGLSGFPKTIESEYDVFNTGHSSTSISAALGIARARDIKNEKYKVICVIGDGALTGGMALEALNDVGASKTDIIVVLNDNEMSISKNNGGLARALTKMRTRRFYTNSNKVIKEAVAKVPKFGNLVIKQVHKIKYQIKKMVLPNMMFEDIGFKYLGPVNGNDIEKVESLLKRAKDLSGPILIHCKTIKGKGYKPAELNPDKYHSVGPFNIKTGMPIAQDNESYSSVFGEEITKLAKENKKIVAITAAMSEGTGLTKFKKEYPNRFFDVEIAEQHAVTMAAGLAINGCIPVVAMYSSFLQRAYDQILHDVCMQNLHVTFCLDRSGIVGSDGETHQGLYDMAFLKTIPNTTIMSPKDYKELKMMIKFATESMSSPVIIRYPKGSESKIQFKECEKIELGKAEKIDIEQYLKDDVETIYLNGDADTILNYKVKNKNVNENKKTSENSVTIVYKIKIIAIGRMVSKAIEVAQILYKRDRIKAEIYNARFIKPFDTSIIKNTNNSDKTNILTTIVTIEDGTLKGGLFSEVTEQIQRNNIEHTKIIGFGYDDKFVQQGSIEKLEEINGLNVENIYNKIIKNITK